MARTTINNEMANPAIAPRRIREAAGAAASGVGVDEVDSERAVSVDDKRVVPVDIGVVESGVLVSSVR